MTQSQQTQKTVEYLADDIGDLQRRVGALEYVGGGKVTGPPVDPENPDPKTPTPVPKIIAPKLTIDFWAQTQADFKRPLTELVDNSHLDLSNIVLALRTDRDVLTGLMRGANA